TTRSIRPRWGRFPAATRRSTSSGSGRSRRRPGWTETRSPPRRASRPPCSPPGRLSRLPSAAASHLPARPASMRPPTVRWAGAARCDRAFAGVVARAGRSVAPALRLVSGAFDAHQADPLRDCRLGDDAFRWMAGGAGTLGPRVAAVLEGGYSIETLPGVVAAA